MSLKIYTPKTSAKKIHDFFEVIDELTKDYTEEKRDEIKLVFEEAFVNIADYAYKKKEKKALIVFNKKNGNLCITLIDSGPAFNPLAHPEPDTKNIVKEGGFGVFLIKKCSDKAIYRRFLGQNVLIVHFKKISHY